MTTRDELQRAGLNKWVQAKFKGILNWATGVGKTRATILAVEKITQLIPNAKILIVAPTTVILDSIESEFKKFNSEHLLTSCKLICYKSLPKETEVYDLVVLDEIHHCTSPIKLAWLSKNRYRSLLGLSASLTKLQQIKLKPYCQIVDTLTLDNMVNLGFVTEFVILNYPVTLSPSEKKKYDSLSYRISKYAMDTGGGTLWSAVSARSRLLYTAENKILAVNQLLEVFPSEKGMLFTLSIDSCKEVATLIGDSCIAVHSKLSPKERKARLENFKLGTNNVRLLSTPKILDEGVNVPDVSFAIAIARYSKERQLIQTLGRIIRLSGSQKKAYLIRLYVKDTVEENWIRAAEETFETIYLPLNIKTNELREITGKGLQ